MDAHNRQTSAAGQPTGIQLLANAQRAGVTLTRTWLGIDLGGPPQTRPLIAALRDRSALLRNTFWVYTGVAPLLDWRNEHRATVITPARPCHLCRKPTGLLDPFDHRPCHKLCAEAAIAPLPVPHRVTAAA
jgi:hypothetical protein